jgi:hypothetical protein
LLCLKKLWCGKKLKRLNESLVGITERQQVGELAGLRVERTVVVETGYFFRMKVSEVELMQ